MVHEPCPDGENDRQHEFPRGRAGVARLGHGPAPFAGISRQQEQHSARRVSLRHHC